MEEALPDDRPLGLCCGICLAFGLGPVSQKFQSSCCG